MEEKSKTFVGISSKNFASGDGVSAEYIYLFSKNVQNLIIIAFFVDQ
jgi:hypothetical protein